MQVLREVLVFWLSVVVFGQSDGGDCVVLLGGIEGSGGGVEVKKVEPGLGDRALIDFLEGGAVEGELRGVK